MRRIGKRDIVLRRDIFEAYMPEEVADSELVSASLLHEVLEGVLAEARMNEGCVTPESLIRAFPGVLRD